MPRTRKPAIAAANPSKGRSKVSNGTELFHERVDGRTPHARRFRDLVVDFSDAVGGEPNVAQLTLIRRVATLALQCEIDEFTLATTGEIDSDKYARRANILSALIARLGLARMSSDRIKHCGGTGPMIDHHTAALTDVTDV